ncbi:MAG: DNA polymerase I [Desulfobacteraceae bacterium]|nr:DNA polymerase I [Desulfobacteraceae bacterium]MCF8095693.1 DNA polymerase I [Desulfobacteraceae bacterium]
MTDEKRIYLIDGSTYIHRAYHAIRSLSTSRGFPTNAAYGFARMLIKLIHDRDPAYVAMVFDSRGPTFRHEMYPDYKGHRPEMPEDLAMQIPVIHEITEGFNIPVIMLEGYEADDLIGALASQAEESGFEVIMVSGDKDMIQMLTDRVSMWDPMKDEVTDRRQVVSVRGVEPSQMVDIQGLSGDTADNIPGVPGIGDKTAVSLIKTYGSMDNLYARLSGITASKQREKLAEYKDQAFLSRKLAKIDTNAPVKLDLDALARKPPDNKKLARMFRDLEFRRLQELYPVVSDLSLKDYQGVTDEAALDAMVEKLRDAGCFALDTETTSTEAVNADLVGLSFAVEQDRAFYVPCGHTGEDAFSQLSRDLVLARLKPVLQDPETKKVGQNIKYDWTVLRRYGVDLAGVVFDTMLASYLLNPEKRAHGLNQIAMDYLDHRMITFDEVISGDQGKLAGFAQVPVEKAVVYACEDADITLAAYRKLEPMLLSAGLSRLMSTIELPLVPVLMKMEEAGIRVDKDRLAAMSKDLAAEIERSETEIYAAAGEKFNINSSQQLGRILFDKLKLPTQKKTKKKTGYSTDVEVLTSLCRYHELPVLILRHRELSKLKSTYVDALFGLINPKTGRIHTSFNQTVTATGRLSSSNPNLQNIPVRTEAGKDVRRAFIPKDGWYFVAADYSQIELRLLAHYSQDEILTEAFAENEDIHTRTAAEVFMVEPDNVTEELRRQAKTINFGIIYGMGAYSLSKDLGITPKMARTYIDHYFARYHGVKEFIDLTIENARKTGRVGTEFSRIRYIPDINSKNANMRGFAERTAINTPIQGTAADLLKMAMIRVDAALSEKRLKSAMLLTVHDELVFEVPEDEIEQVCNLARQIMENIAELSVPLKVNISVGNDWAAVH